MKNDKLVGYILQDNVTLGVKPKIKARTEKTITFDTTLQTGSTNNRNKRNYPSDLLESGFRSEFVRERLMTNSWGGEAEHPESDEPQRLIRLERRNIGHFVRKWHRDGNEFRGEVQTAATECGRELMDMILENDLITGFSMRGFGETKVIDDCVVVTPPFRLFYYDGVTHPSHRNAYMDNSLTESTRSIPISMNLLESMNMKDPVLFENMHLVGLLTEASEFKANANGLIVTGNDMTMQVILNETAKNEINDFFTSLVG